ncbi:hypothetical protein ANO14919_078680 [Xylariales sp. No.14919]|nr:hypothetical protein ANO14919_078680 [Xylariales sp. No.14919]
MAPNSSRAPWRGSSGTNNRTRSFSYDHNNYNADQGSVGNPHTSVFGSGSRTVNHYEYPLVSQNFAGGQFPDYQDNSALTYDLSVSSSLFPTNGSAASVVGDLSYQHPAYPAYWTSPQASTYTIPSRNTRYQCPYCFDGHGLGSFNRERDFVRHLTTSKVHRVDGTPSYHCCCNYYARPRKDHHIRHVESCNAPAIIPYTCICGRECQDKEEHKEHVIDCGRLRRRRVSIAS